MIRLFIAIDLPEAVKDDIMSTYAAIPGAKWMDSNQLHLTLRFIGDVGEDLANDIHSRLRALKSPPFTLKLKGVGFFPPRKVPRVLWCGVQPSDELMRLQGKVERLCVDAGLEPEGRKYSPHVTVARLSSSPPERLADYMASNSLFESEVFDVSEFILYSSLLRKEGAVHIKEETYMLEA